MTSFLLTDIAHGLTGRLGEGERFEGALRVRDGRIAAMGALSPEPGERVMDARGAVVMPGLVNTHHHLFQSVMKAVPAALDLPLDPWLMAVPYGLWPFLDEETFRISVTIGMAELAMSGCTTICDHHYIWSDRFDYDPAEILFETAARFGIRFVLAHGGGTKGRATSDPSVPPIPCDPLDGWLSRVQRIADRWHDPAPDAMTRVAVAPTTPTFNVDPGALGEIAATARGRGLRLHTHLSENRAYVDFTESRFGMRPVPWLAQHDWLGPDVWFAHLVEADADEVAILAESGSAMAHCPQANARLGSGIAPAAALHAAGGTVSLAVDGAGANEAADMGSALYAAFCLHRATGGAGAVRAETILHWASAGGARVLGLDAVGTLEIGKAADIAIVDLSHPRYLGQHDAAVGPVVSGGGLTLRHAFVAGREIVTDGVPAGLDLGALGDDARRVTERMIRRHRHAAAA
ncbi:amidohydrolase family protein [Palleronia sp. LCG004]|uniref:amidohydrolase family protein n=1 Tax=Palleronia sp. LCG004 TaxID=3079304 RepID=UPI002941DC1D|nr:amidohydrolase family protein [Palleronia sp. LCG004]WOI55804.1 amidohydrolase family protein [Palleronia sp. LCG004]